MKNNILKTVLLLLAIVAFSLMAMGSEDEVSTDDKPNGSGSESYELETDASGKIILPKNHDAFEGEDKFDVAKELESYGFTNITYSPQMDLITGWLTKDGSVVSVSIDGKSSFMKNAAFAPDAPIIITYHTFTGDYCTNGLKHTEEVDKGHPATCTEDGLTDGAHCSVCQKVLKEQTVIPAGHTIVIDKAVPATQTASGLSEGKHCSACGEVLVEQKVVYWSITVENNQTFANLFSPSKQTKNEEIKAFATQYKGARIEFDGSLDYAIHKTEYDERTFDYYFTYGDYSTGEPVGPVIKGEAVYAFEYKKDSVVSFYENLHVVATVSGFERFTGNLLIELESVTHRNPTGKILEYDTGVSEITHMPVMKGSSIDAVLACAKQFGVSYVPYPEEDWGHGSYSITVCSWDQHLSMDIIYSIRSKEIIYARISPDMAVPMDTQKQFIIEMSKVLCPAKDSGSAVSFATEHIGEHCVNYIDGTDYLFEPINGMLYYTVGNEKWEDWEISFGNAD